MGPLYGHFFNDLVSRRLWLETAVPVVGWIERCHFRNTDVQGEWLADDALSDGLLRVLGAMGRDAAPVILDVARRVEAWADQRPAALEEPPRVVGSARTSLRGTPVERVAMPYSLWMVQRTIDAYGALGAEERQRVDAAMDGTGWEAVLAYEPRHRLSKRGFRLAFE